MPLAFRITPADEEVAVDIDDAEVSQRPAWRTVPSKDSVKIGVWNEIADEPNLSTRRGIAVVSFFPIITIPDDDGILWFSDTTAILPFWSYSVARPAFEFVSIFQGVLVDWS